MKDISFNPGGLPDRKDGRDITVENLLGGAAPAFDWDKKVSVLDRVAKAVGNTAFRPPIKNQYQSGSCGGQATSWQDAAEEAIETGSFEEESAKAVIARTYVLGPNGVMLGSRMRDNLEIATGPGIPREALCPSYPASGEVTDAFMNRPLDLSVQALEDGLARKAKGYAFIESVTNIDAVAAAVDMYNGAQMLIRGQNGKGWLSEAPAITDAPEWGHFMSLVEPCIYKGKKAIKAVQSWGIQAGEQGYQYFSEDWFKSGFITQIGVIIRPEKVAIPDVYVFTRDLFVGKTGPDVKALQRYLNTHGAPLAQSGDGSLGKETTYFGALTQAAVARFQRDHGIKPAAGYFGPLTRSFINSHP